jgi:DNA polymerase III psi subunit
MEENIIIQDNAQAIKYLMEGDFYMVNEKTHVNGISYTGNYAKKVLLLVNEELTESTKELLTRILKFAGLTELDYALVSPSQWAGKNINYIVNNFQPNKIIAWGETLFPMLPIFVTEKFEGIDIVSSVSLSALDKNADAKKSLAAAIKTLLQ